MAQFSNQATLSYNGTVANSNIVTGELTQSLRVWKDATYDIYSAGDILTYAVSIQNFGDTDMTGLIVTDDLGEYAFAAGTAVPLTYTGDPVLYYINGILQTPPSAAAGPPLVISGVNVPAGLSAIIIYRVEVNGYAPLGQGASIENAVSVSGGGLSESLTASERVTANQAARLSIIKAINPTAVMENSRLTYTFTLENTGAAAAGASAGIIISDTFSPQLTAPVEVTLNKAEWPQTGNFSYNSVTGEFATVTGRVTVPAATYSQDPLTGLWSAVPGVTTLTVSGII